MAHTNIDIEKKYVTMKKDVSEHLAKTFFDKKNKKSPNNKKRKKIIFFSIAICFVMLFTLTYLATKNNFFSKSLYVILDKTPTAIEYDFSTPGNAKIRAISFNLNNIDLSRFNFLVFSLRTLEQTKIDSTIKVGIENSFSEKDAKYLSGINNRWEKFSLPLRNFKFINDWKTIKSLTFIVEEWNISNNKGKIYIDDVRFTEK